MKVTAKEIEAALFRHYERQGSWIVLREVTIDDEEALATAKGRSLAAKRRSTTRRRIDMLLISHKNGSSAKIKRERLALEIKVSRADFKSETDEKRAPWRGFADKFAYVAPKGMIKPEELPEGCGLLEYATDEPFHNQIRWKVLAKADPTVNRGLSPNFAHYILNRLHDAEAKLRRLQLAPVRHG